MDGQITAALLETLMGIQQELRAAREERKSAQLVHVHMQPPRVSIDTVLLSLASALIAAAAVVACSHG